MIEKNKEWVEGAEAAKIEQWKDGKYFVSGKFAAMAAQYMGIAPPMKEDNAVMTDGSDRDPYAPAQFTAGWYWGIAEKDKRDEILKCYKTDVDLTNALYDGMEAYIAGDKATGDAKIADTKPLYKKALADCGKVAEHMGEWAQKLDDLAKIADWDKVSMQIYKANKNIIDGEIKDELLEWSEGVFFDSGMFAGRLGKIFIDNAPQPQRTFMSDTTKDPTAPAQYIAGWFYGVSQEDDRDELLKCFKQSDDLTNKLYDAMESIIAGDVDAGDKKMAETRPLFETAIAGCSQEILKKMGDNDKKFEDLKARSDWATIRMDIYNKNKSVIDRDSQLAMREWKEGVFFNTGMFFGDVEKIFLDNAPAEEVTAPGRDQLAPAEFSAGWYYGLSGHDKRDKVLECYEKNPHLTNKLYDAMEAYIAGDVKKGDAKMDETRPLFKKALNECRRLDYHMFGKWAERVDEMVERADWKEFAMKIFNANKDVIVRDVDLEIREWKQGVHFNSGMFAGQIQKIFLDA